MFCPDAAAKSSLACFDEITPISEDQVEEKYDISGVESSPRMQPILTRVIIRHDVMTSRKASTSSYFHFHDKSWLDKGLTFDPRRGFAHVGSTGLSYLHLRAPRDTCQTRACLTRFRRYASSDMK